MATVKLLDPNDPTRRLDRYELIGEIASGGMATVFLARLGGVGGFQRFVAIKRLHPHLAGDREFVEMFLDEARLAAGIHHPHVVPILEVGTTESGFYLVMEYVEGDTLARIFARAMSAGSDVPRPVLIRVMLDALAGLNAAHELADASGQPLQIVHRDCSPQNILIGIDGASRLTDFGVARARARLSSTRSDKLKGKLSYMSPEQARGTDLDRRSDVFAMGVMLWEVLAARRLFKADNEAATLSRLLIEPIPRLASITAIHPALDEVSAKALARERDDRWSSATEMADALERAAREAAPPGETGVASPREVAAYVQAALGQEIAAQRESVRVWLAQSEPSEASPGSVPWQTAERRIRGATSSAPPPGPERALGESEEALTRVKNGSSISSAAMTVAHLPGGEHALAAPEVPLTPRRTVAVLVGFAAVGLLAAGLVWAFAGSGGAALSSSPTSDPPAAEPGAAPSPAGTTQSPEEPGKGGAPTDGPDPADDGDEGTPSSLAPEPRRTSAAPRPPRPPAPPSPRTAEPAKPKAEPSSKPSAKPPASDDLSNPYR